MARPNARRVKRHRNYTVEDAAQTLGITKATVRNWIARGLRAVTDRRPWLILGDDLLVYCRDPRAPKQSCALHECFCLKCRTPRSPAGAIADFTPLTTTSGNMSALCPVCETLMFKRVAYGRLPELEAKLLVQIRQAHQHLMERA